MYLIGSQIYFPRNQQKQNNLGLYNLKRRNDISIIIDTFAGAIQMEEYQGLLTYSITNPTLTWAKMFGMMERAKRQLNIEDYSLGQTSLEQVSSFFW